MEHSLGRHESRAAVDDQRATRLILISRRLEAVPDLHLKLSNIEWSACIEELGSVSKLQKTSLTHGLLHYNIQNLAHGLAISSPWVVDISSVDDILSFIVDEQGDLLAHELALQEVSLIDWLSRPDVEARVNELANHKLDSFGFSVDGFADFVCVVLVG